MSPIRLLDNIQYKTVSREWYQTQRDKMAFVTLLPGEHIKVKELYKLIQLRNPKIQIWAKTNRKNWVKKISLICYYAAVAEVGALNSIFYPFFPQYPNLTYFWTLYFLHKRKFDQNLKELCFRSSLFFNSWGSELLFVKNKGKKGKVLNATAQRRTHTSLVNSPNQSPEPIKCQSLLLSVLMIGQPTFADAQRKLEGSHHQ